MPGPRLRNTPAKEAKGDGARESRELARRGHTVLLRLRREGNAHCGEEQLQWPRLLNLRGKDGVDNAIISCRPRCYGQDARFKS